MNGYNQMARRPAPSSSAWASQNTYGNAGPMPTSKVLMMNARADKESDRPRYNPLNAAHPRSSSLLNVQDPVAMHLLMETAMVDSAEYEVLSYEEIEELKKEHALLSNRIEATRRKFALETKLRDAAHSLNRLYSSKNGRGGDDSLEGPLRSPTTKTRRSLLGRKTSGNTTLLKTDDEYAASAKKCEDLAQELWGLQQRDQDVKRRILEHTAGVLQMTHKGLKKNIRREELPQSPESMASQNHRSVPPFDGSDEFDDRSLYRMQDYQDDYVSGRSSRANGASGQQADLRAIDDAEKRLQNMTGKLSNMMLQLDSQLSVEQPPRMSTSNGFPRPGSQLPSYVEYVERSLDTMALAQARTVGTTQRTISDSEGQLEETNSRLYDMLAKTTSSRTPVIPRPDQGSRNLRSQLSFVGLAVGQLTQRIDHFVEQKTILTTQIQQQRELNTKSDAQRDAQIADLTKQLSESKRMLATNEQESQATRDQIDMLIEQLDEARQQVNLREQQRFMDESKALQAEREVQRQALDRLQSELKSKQQDFGEIQASLSKSRDDLEIQSQQHDQKLHEVSAAKESAEIESRRCRDELEVLEGEVARAQTELTVVRAELDGAYGTRAQRAADVSSNPAVQKEIDSLNDKNSSLMREIEYFRNNQATTQIDSTGLQSKVDTLQKELKETIEDYELMTKAGIEFERERDQLEVIIDGLRERCDGLEGQLSDERVRWMGMKSPNGQLSPGNGTSETTSTMVLKNEFKKMMRDTRTENLKALRAEQEERRRLEVLVRSLRKDQPSLQKPSQGQRLST